MLKKKHNFSLLLLFPVLFLSCFALPKLELSETAGMNNSSLETQGFYYSKTEYTGFVFYLNGVLFGPNAFSKKSLSNLKNYYSNNEMLKFAYKIPYVWGYYKIERNEIFIQKWISADYYYDKTSYKGRVLNDTTLVINHPGAGLDTFYFQYLETKPDSINRFTEK